MLRNLCDADKTDLVQLLSAIEKTFALYWQHYAPYQTLQDRSSALDDLLRDNSPDNRRGTFILCLYTAVTLVMLCSVQSPRGVKDLARILSFLFQSALFINIPFYECSAKYCENVEPINLCGLVQPHKSVLNSAPA